MRAVCLAASVRLHVEATMWPRGPGPGRYFRGCREIRTAAHAHGLPRACAQETGSSTTRLPRTPHSPTIPSPCEFAGCGAGSGRGADDPAVVSSAPRPRPSTVSRVFRSRLSLGGLALWLRRARRNCPQTLPWRPASAPLCCAERLRVLRAAGMDAVAALALAGGVNAARYTHCEEHFRCGCERVYTP